MFSVVVLISGDAPEAARVSVASVLGQTWSDWQLVVVVQGSGSRDLDVALQSIEGDPRIRFVRQHTPPGRAEAYNSAFLESAGQWLVLLGHGDRLMPQALSTMAAALRDQPAAVLAYSDWVSKDPDSGVVEVFRKPDWSPERLRGHEYVSDLTALRRSAVGACGGFRPEYGEAALHDLLLRVTEDGGGALHVAEPLYVRNPNEQQSTPQAWDAGVRAVQAHCDRIGMSAVVRRGSVPGTFHLRRTPLHQHRVSVVIPSRGSQAVVFGEPRTLVVEAVRSMLSASPEWDFEVVIVADEPIPKDYPGQLKELLGHRLVMVSYDKPFNFSEKSNLGAIHASGDILIFANDDLEIISPRWIEEMVAIAEQPDVGLVGANLRFEDGSVQHAGHIYFDGIAAHAHFGEQPSSGYFVDLVVDHEASGATAALVACRREVWEQVGGFCNLLPGSFNDVDYCMKIRSLGYRIVIAMGVQSWHFESKTRDPSVEEWEIHFLQNRWRSQMKTERYMRARG